LYSHRASTSFSNTEIETSERPQRLKVKVKSQNTTSEGPKVVLIRNPVGPPTNEEARKSTGFAPRVHRQSVGKALVA